MSAPSTVPLVLEYVRKKSGGCQVWAMVDPGLEWACGFYVMFPATLTNSDLSLVNVAIDMHNAAHPPLAAK